MRPESVRSLFEYSLPEEIIEQIVRLLSHRPRSVHWQRFVQASDVVTALDASEALRCEALKQFRSTSLFGKLESRDAPDGT